MQPISRAVLRGLRVHSSQLLQGRGTGEGIRQVLTITDAGLMTQCLPGGLSATNGCSQHLRFGSGWHDGASLDFQFQTRRV